MLHVLPFVGGVRLASTPIHLNQLFAPRPHLSCRAEPPGDYDGGSIRSQVKELERLFRIEAAPEGEDSQQDRGGVQAPEPCSPLPGVIRDLPLWRVQWAVLPGYQEVLHVHVPHYVDMFGRLLAGPRPWRFGHLLLPGGSQNLGSAEYEMQPYSQAPLTGTLMEVLQAVTFPDGRMLILAAGLGRFRVLQPRQHLPHSRAEVAFFPDLEETVACEGSLTSSETDGSPTAAGDDVQTHVQGIAALAAAASVAQQWWQYEASTGRVVDKMALIDGENEAAAMEFGRRLVAIGSNEVLELPYWPPNTSRSEGAASHEVSAASDKAESMLRDVALAAEHAVQHAVEELQEMDAAVIGRDWCQVLGGTLNTVEERGVKTVASNSDEPGGKEENEEDLPIELDGKVEVALALEAQVWAELYAVCALAEKISGRTPPLADGLLCLRPPPGATAGAAGPGQHAHPAYPPLRRAQRLSYALASAIGSVTNSEGRQEWLEAISIAARLRLGLEALRTHRSVLAAVVEVRKLDSTTDE